MTYISITELEERRRKGLSPKCGPVPPDQYDQIVGKEVPGQMTPQDRCKELQGILSTAWDHPGDTRLWRRVYELIGKVIAPAEIHRASDYVHRIEQDPLKILERCDSYEEMMQMAAQRAGS
jgi:hypothetical protein